MPMQPVSPDRACAARGCHDISGSRSRCSDCCAVESASDDPSSGGRGFPPTGTPCSVAPRALASLKGVTAPYVQPAVSIMRADRYKETALQTQHDEGAHLPEVHWVPPVHTRVHIPRDVLKMHHEDSSWIFIRAVPRTVISTVISSVCHTLCPIQSKQTDSCNRKTCLEPQIPATFRRRATYCAPCHQQQEQATFERTSNMPGKLHSLAAWCGNAVHVNG